MKLETTFYHSEAKSGRIWGSILGLMVIPFVGIALGSSAMRASETLGWSLLGASVAMMIAAGVMYTRAIKSRSGTVNIGPKGVELAGATLARDKIVTAAFTPAIGTRPPSVRIVGKNDRELAWIGVSDPEQGDQVLSSLGLAAEQTTAQFFALAKWGSRGFSAVIGFNVVAVLALVLAMAVFHIPALALVTMLPAVFSSAYFIPAKVHVGSDGLLYKMRLGSQFFAWGDVLGVEPIEKGVTVLLKNGERYDIPTVSRGKMYYEYERVAQASLVSRASAALAKFNGGAVPEVSARVARLGRTKDEWIATLLDREGSFRDAPIRNDDLWKVVESPGAKVTARAGAAAVLSQDASEEDRARLRIAADTCVEPRLRVVLEKAASGEDAMEALAQVEDEDEQARRA